MRIFNIEKPNEDIRKPLQDKIDNLNKPKGSLGMLEEIALKIGMIQQTLEPSLSHPCHLLLGADHGIEKEGVSVSPREITWQQMINFSKGGGGVNMFCRQHNFDLSIVDMGVDYDLSAYPSILNNKVAWGTQDFLYGPAMSEEQMNECIEKGAALVDSCKARGCNVICLGEMGIGNTSPSSIWMSLFGNIPLGECIGAGAGLNDKGIQHKKEVLEKAVENYQKWLSNLDEAQKNRNIVYKAANNEKDSTQNQYSQQIIMYFGGFEMVAAIGAMLRAAEQKMVVLVDGFIMTACMLAASQLYPEVLNYALFGHCGDEHAHRKMLELMDAKPLLNLGLRLGEGTGALCAYPIVESAIHMINEMNNFDNANITKYF